MANINYSTNNLAAGSLGKIMTKTTISDLEAQRAQILQEIEAKAGKISQNSSDGTTDSANPSLNDWLSAAEEVMPEPVKNDVSSDVTLRKTVNSTGNGEQLMSNDDMKSKNSTFFTIVIVFTLFLTIIGVLFIVYSSLSNEIEKLQTSAQGSEQFTELQNKVTALEEQLGSQNSNEELTQSQQQIEQLNNELSLVKEQLVGLQKELDQYTNNQKLAQSGQAMKLNGQETNGQNLEKLVQGQLQAIISQLSSSQDSDNSNSESNIAQPAINEPSIAVIENTVAPELPKTPDAPVLAQTEDVKWLLAQNGKNYILQLASMPTEDAAEKVKLKHNFKDAKVIPQERKGVVNYVLVTGSFENKPNAQLLSAKIKKDTGIAPWIRQIEDIARRVQ